MKESVKVIIRQNRMWDNPETRREFEREHGFGPLPKPDSDEWNEWWMRGDLLRYHEGFYEWSLAKAQGMPSEGPRREGGSGALSTGKPGPKDAPSPSPSPAAGR